MVDFNLDLVRVIVSGIPFGWLVLGPLVAKWMRPDFHQPPGPLDDKDLDDLLRDEPLDPDYEDLDKLMRDSDIPVNSLSPPWILFSEDNKPLAILPAGRSGEVANIEGLSLEAAHRILDCANGYDPNAPRIQLSNVPHYRSVK